MEKTLNASSAPTACQELLGITRASGGNSKIRPPKLIQLVIFIFLLMPVPIIGQETSESIEEIKILAEYGYVFWQRKLGFDY